MSAAPPLMLRSPRSPRSSLLEKVAVIELLTLVPRSVERVFDLSEGGLGVFTQSPLPVGRLVLGVVRLPGETSTHDVIVRVAWVDAHGAMGLEFVMPDEALLAAVRRTLAQGAEAGDWAAP